MTTCPTCGHRAAKPKTVQPVDLASMTDKDRFAHFKATAPREDMLFIARVLPVLAPEVQAILDTRTPTKKDAFHIFDRARHVLTPQPVIDEDAFWRHHCPPKAELPVAA